MTTDNPLPIFIGYDAREDAAYRVCVASLERTASTALRIEPLKHRTLRNLGLLTRPWQTNADGQTIDAVDRKPFSTEFSHSRFLTPAYARHLGIASGWVLFIDCDFLFLTDVAKLFSLADRRYAVMCVQHAHDPSEAVKMDGVAQTRYRRKNWSSCMLINLDHPANNRLSVADVNSVDGGWLHALSWLNDDEIGPLPLSWNWLEGTSSLLIKPSAVHFTRGGPWFLEYADVHYAAQWHQANLDAQIKQLQETATALRLRGTS